MQDLFGEDKPVENVPKKKPIRKDEMKDKFPEPESFENAMAKLEEVLRKLESGQVSLEASLEVYSEAKFLAKWCYKRLNSIQGELKKLGLDEDGKLSLEDFPSLD